MSSFDTKSFFNNSDFSDVTIKFSGREIKCHKMILCGSDYFEKLCGPSSSFKEKAAQVIELKDDDPRALENVLRYIYGDEAVDPNLQRDWKYQLEMAKTACKYLFPTLEDAAMAIFKLLVNRLTDTRTIHEAITHIRVKGDQQKHFDIANALEMRHIHALLKDDTYRAGIEEDKELVWSHMDRLNCIDDPVMVEAAVCSCCRELAIRKTDGSHSRLCRGANGYYHQYSGPCVLSDWVKLMVPRQLAEKAGIDV